MAGTSQRRAVNNYRRRIRQRGLARFEVLGRAVDRDLIRSLARRLADDTADSARVRALVTGSIQPETPRKGGILTALRRSPLVGCDLDLRRPFARERKVDL